MTKRIGIAAVFLVGCAVGGASSQLVVPRASAQQAATLTNWEYSCWDTWFEHLQAPANKFGSQGWEMVGLSRQVDDSAAVCFKRPKM